MTPIEAARIRLEGAQSNHKPSRHLRKQYVLAVAKDIRDALMRSNEEQELPLFEVKQ